MRALGGTNITGGELYADAFLLLVTDIIGNFEFQCNGKLANDSFACIF
jgi:hypothetical protein